MIKTEPITKDNPESYFATQDDLEPEHYQPTPISRITCKPIKLHYVNPQSVETVNPEEDKPDMVPTTLLVAKKVKENEGRLFFKSLFDSGGTSVMINKRALPPNCEV
jgi:hypothetical protein